MVSEFDKAIRFKEFTQTAAFNNQTALTLSMDVTLDGFTPKGIVHVFQSGSYATFIEKFYIQDWQTANVTLRRYNNQTWTGNIPVTVIVIYEASA